MKDIALRDCRGQDWNQFLGREGFESERGGEMPEVDVITQFELWPTISPIFSQGRQREEQLPGINGRSQRPRTTQGARKGGVSSSDSQTWISPGRGAGRCGRWADGELWCALRLSHRGSPQAQ